MLANNGRLILVLALTFAAIGFAIADPPRSRIDYSACPEPVPLYRLDAKYHQLPEAFVRDFLDHPPSPRPFQDDVVCKSASGPEGVLNYCVCFGELPCVALKESKRCSSEIGLHPSGRAGVCRAATAERFVNPCVVYSVTVG